jgi:hypothetical protein
MPKFDRKGIKTNMIGTRAQLKGELDSGTSGGIRLRKLTELGDESIKIYGEMPQGADQENLKAENGHKEYMNKF